MGANLTHERVATDKVESCACGVQLLVHLCFDHAGRLTHLVPSSSSCLWVIHPSRRRDLGNDETRRTWHMADPRTTPKTTRTSFCSKSGPRKIQKAAKERIVSSIGIAKRLDLTALTISTTSTRRWQIEREDVSVSPTYSVKSNVSVLPHGTIVVRRAGRGKDVKPR